MKHKAKQRPTQYPSYTFQIEAFSHEGRGIAHYGTHPDHPKEKHGKKVFIRYALVGETVQAKITNQTSRLEEADMVKLESEAAEGRVDPICPHFGVCGGCSLQHIHPDEQIVLKQNVLKSHLQHFAGLQPEQWLDPIRSVKADYRRRARIGVRYIAKQNRLVMGFREHHSNHLTAIQQCQVLDQTLSECLPELKKLLESLTGKAHINVKGVLNGCHTALVHLQQASFARVINLSSASAIYGQADLASYSASKFAVRGLTEALDVEWQKYNIRVLDVMPLFVQTNMVKDMDAGSIQNIGVDLTPADVAKQVLHLAQQKDHALLPTHTPVGIKTKLMYQLSSMSPQFLNRLTNIFLAKR